MQLLRKYTMQDRSTGKATRTDKNLSVQDALTMTDYTEDEANKILDLDVGQSLLIDGIYIERTA